MQVTRWCPLLTSLHFHDNPYNADIVILSFANEAIETHTLSNFLQDQVVGS